MVTLSFVLGFFSGLLAVLVYRLLNIKIWRDWL